MDTTTLAYYEAAGADLARRYESAPSPVSVYYGVAFPTGSRVLDVGAGSGRDLAALLAGGYDAYGVEPSNTLRTAAIQLHPELASRIAEGRLPELEAPFGGDYDGILCSAVLMHLPEAEVFDAAFTFRRLLKKGGRLLVSIPGSRDDIGEAGRDASGRLFQPYTAEYLQLLFERIGLQMIGRWDSADALGRSGVTWSTLLFQLTGDGSGRAVDKIEGILNRDRKVATYKLALFRALAEIATQEPRAARWRADGMVAVPLRKIAERWLLYYWPLVTSERFIPQSQTEGAGGKPVAFRSSLKEFAALFASQGDHCGLSSWQMAVTRGNLGAGARRAHAAALSSIEKTIRSGPVAHAGGSLESGFLFDYSGETKEVVMPTDIWHELTLLGHWIVDAVIIRWASITERFAHRQSVTSADVLPLLLVRPAPERATAFARGVFLKSGVKRCAWSMRPIVGANFCVDHVIPFALWGNNDLWNLLPVDARVNGDKSDKLPASSLLLSQRSEILFNWEALRDEVPLAFDGHAERLLGRKPSGVTDWQSELFDGLRQAIEFTAVQRGIERWLPKQPASRNMASVSLSAPAASS